MYDDGGMIDGDGTRYISAGSISPVAMFFENEIATIETYIDYLSLRGFSILVTNKIDAVRAARQRLQDEAAYLFDMRISNIRKIGTRNTHHGLAAGITMVCDVTNDGKDSNIRHCATLTAFDTDTAAEGTYDILRERGQYIDRIRKEDESFGKFQKFISTYETDYAENIKSHQVERNIEAVGLAFGELLPNEQQIQKSVAAMLGYVGADFQIWQSNKKTRAVLASQDMKDRIEALAYIKHGLMVGFGSNNSAEQAEWIHAARDALGGLSAWQRLISGKIDDIFMVSALVNEEIG